MLHLKYEKITVINNMQLLHYIDIVAIRTRPVHRRVICYDIQDKTRQDKTFIIVTLQVQLFGTQLARKR